MSAYDDHDLDALNRLEDLLEAYCEARLAPQGAVLARIRANILTEAAAAASTTAAASRLRLVETGQKAARWSFVPRFSRPAPTPGRWSLPSRFTRTAFALGFAATLTVGTTLSVLAAPPGSPFYNARVFMERLSLPAQAEARLEGHEKLLEERIAEAKTAAASGNTVALEAALAAYQTEVKAATEDAGSDLDRLAHLEDMLAKHTAVLTALATRLPAQSSIENAIEQSSKAITKLQEKTHPTRPTHPVQGGAQGGQGGSQGGAQNADRD